MRLAVIADIHANLEALSAVQSHLDRQRVDQVVCLGDVIGYNASPSECVAHLMQGKVPTIRGNHERMILGKVGSDVRQETMDVIEFSQDLLSVEQMKWIESLPDHRIHMQEYLLVHGSPRDPDEYLTTPDKLKTALAKMRATFGGLEICFFGHTHSPIVFSKDEAVEKIHEDRKVPLKRRHLYMVNPGSVGQPRDGCPKASYAILDTDEYAAHFFRVPYDVEGAKRRIKEAGLSDKLAARLTYGK